MTDRTGISKQLRRKLPPDSVLGPVLDSVLVLAGSALFSLAAILWCWRRGELLLYGDAVAHLHIARRLFDAHQPGIVQLGSVWLPLPHLLLAPFAANHAWWRNGVAGILPSAACYLLASVGLYRLARLWLPPVPAGLALVFFAANPNLLYLQTTAMTEPLFLAEMIGATLFLVLWHRSLDAATNRAPSRTMESVTEHEPEPAQQPGRSGKLLWAAIGILIAAVFTRYDGWIYACLAWCAMAAILLRRGRLLRPNFVLASVVLLLAPLSWIAYNAIFFGDPLDFERGPYSAQAIEIRTAGLDPARWSQTSPPHPGWHNMPVATLFFLKAAEMDAVAAPHGGSLWGNLIFAATLLATLTACFRLRRRGIGFALLLWLPLPFYGYSVAYGSVPIFLPVWWPHSWYNTRYGMELLPALSLFGGFAAAGLLLAARQLRPRLESYAAVALFTLVAINWAAMLVERPLVFAEAEENSTTRVPFEEKLAAALRALPISATAQAGNQSRQAKAKHLPPKEIPPREILMDTSTFSGAIELSGLTLRQTINEGDGRWYRDALADPAGKAAFVVAFDGDPIAQAIQAHPQHLHPVRVFCSPGQPCAHLYASDLWP